ncbi:Hsp33 family molecular chaperone HslO [Qipengyuania flava]|uniref:Hsp33 family molecular chaperone HslO n=1 Tax=Qipengyuania aestuarii TaxID=2867241 RepID=UPI001C8844D1|nr:Hsp33 family molecular chaperone HslO [Qipengyuania aestuarii]MBX7536436.1 Hsp33 family molecular chaperone HslO [Qipengyuania aestuarii]MCA0979060.1 Hsp33 family molecular chaperone HslO [Qipengyuania flava]
MTSTTHANEETFAGRTLKFTIPSRDARGRLVRLDSTLDDILSAHDYPAPITHILAEALVLITLMGSLVKEDGSQVTMQAQTEAGAINLLVCDYKGGELRGYVDFDEDRLAALGANPSLFALFGKGYLAITFDLATGKGRYQGIVPLEGETLAEACETYFLQSEQVPTLIRTAIRSDGGKSFAAGMLLQHLPDGEEGRERLHARLDHPEWEHVAILGGSLKHEELLSSDLSLEAIVWRLFHEESEVLVEQGQTIGKGCRCSVEHYRDVLMKFPEADREEMRNADGIISVDCAFCSRQFPIEA